MFTPLHDRRLRLRSAVWRGLSLAVHGALLGSLLYAARPRILSPSGIQRGDEGRALTTLYWSGKWSDTLEHENGAPKAHLRYQPPMKPAAGTTASAAIAPQHDESSANDQQPRPAGSPLGTLFQGPLSGDVVRPALPVVARDPIVSRDELDGTEGDVVVEITIDEQGSIVQKIVLKSLAPAIDAKVLAALENWRFHPATRNGIAIASKQDVHYHFPQAGRG